MTNPQTLLKNFKIAFEFGSQKENLVKLIDIPVVSCDANLMFAEYKKHIPFPIKRFYFIQNMQTDLIRGKHAHKNLEQVLFCVQGSVEVLLDDGTTKKSVVLKKSHTGLYISSSIWREFRVLSKNAVIFVVASRGYSESDYIRDYGEFVSYVYSRKKRVLPKITEKIDNTISIISYFLKRYTINNN